MRWRLLLFALAAALVYAAIAIVSGVHSNQRAQAGSRSWHVDQAVIRDRILPGGGVAIDEKLTVDFDGTFTGFARDIPLRGDQQPRGLKVGDQDSLYKSGALTYLGSYGEPRTWGSERVNSNVFRIVWHHNTSNQSRTFTSAYQLDDVAERYKQGDVIRSRLWGQYWDSSLSRLNLALVLPTQAKAKISSGPRWIKSKSRQQGPIVFLEAENIPAKQALDLLIILPRGSLGPGISEKPGPLPAISSSLAERNYTTITAAGKQRGALWFVAILLVGFGGAVIIFLIAKLLMRDAAYNKGEIVYDPPAGQSLVGGYGAAEEDKPDKNRAVIATLTDLIARGYYTRDNVRGEDGDWRLKIDINKSRPQERLTSGEAALLEYFDGLLKKGPCRIDQLQDRVWPSAGSKRKYDLMVAELRCDCLVSSAQQRSGSPLVKGLSLVWIVAVAAIIPLLTIPVFRSPALLDLILVPVFLALTTLFVVKWPRGDFVYSGKEAIAQAGQWRNWRDFVLTFSSMETAPDLQVILWERAFAGALLYGVADEFAARAAILLPNLPSQTTVIGDPSFYPIGLGGDIASAATPASTTGSSFGGGFDGGSGSFGGGGFGGGGFGGGGGSAW